MKISLVDQDQDDFYVHEGGDGDDMKAKYEADLAEFNVKEAGINRDRGCTDIICLLLFWAFIGAMGYITVYGYKNGQVQKLTAPIDAGQNFCGFGAMKGFDKMILTDFKLSSGTSILKSGVCIKECPTKGGVALKEGTNCKSNSKVKCEKSRSYETYDAFDFCLPTGKEALTADEQKGYEYVMTMLYDSPAGSIYEALFKSSTSIYISMGLALVWSFVFIYLMSWFAEQLAWCCVVLIQLGLLAATIFSYLTWAKEKKKLDDLKTEQKYDTLDDKAKKKFDDKEGWTVFYFLILLVVMALICCCFFTALMCARDSLKRAIDVIDASADFIASNKLVILIPNFHYILLMVFSVVWLGAFLCVVSLNEVKADSLIP